jgi:hypothetical protein
MTFNKAKKKLKELAGDKFHSITQTESERNGKGIEEFEVFVVGYKRSNSDSWEQALKNLETEVKRIDERRGDR